MSKNTKMRLIKSSTRFTIQKNHLMTALHKNREIKIMNMNSAIISQHTPKLNNAQITFIFSLKCLNRKRKG